MNKALLTILMGSCFFLHAFAQQISIDPNAKPVKMQVYAVLDTATIRVKYKMLSVNDIAKPSEKKENTMVLQIGNNISKFFDYDRMVIDSLQNTFAQQKINSTVATNKILPLMKGTLRLKIYKNYPKGKITVNDRIPFDNYKYEEPLSFPNWKLKDGTRTVCGYKCKEAAATFRGRNYTAWYAPEIPIGDGPWKFGGLPGLILKVEDDKQHYSFECISLEKMQGKNDSINYSDKRYYIKTTREKFLAKQKEFFANPTGAAESSGKGGTSLSSAPKKAWPYNPMELEEEKQPSK